MSYEIPPPDPFSDQNPAENRPKSTKIDISRLQPHELVSLRAEIEARLPVKNLQDTDLVRELVLQVVALQSLQNSVLNDDETPANQRAQVANALSSALANLVKVQGEIFTSERFKKVESLVGEFINGFPEDQKTEAYLKWEALVRRLAGEQGE